MSISMKKHDVLNINANLENAGEDMLTPNNTMQESPSLPAEQ